MSYSDIIDLWAAAVKKKHHSMGDPDLVGINFMRDPDQAGVNMQARQIAATSPAV